MKNPFARRFRYCRNDKEKAEIFTNFSSQEQVRFITFCLRNRKIHQKFSPMIKKLSHKRIEGVSERGVMGILMKYNKECKEFHDKEKNKAQNHNKI